jgi:hypothetical protein
MNEGTRRALIRHDCPAQGAKDPESTDAKVSPQVDDSARRVLRARIAAHALHARVTDPAGHTAPARKAFRSRFEREVDPEGLLDPQERARRAEHAKKAYFLRLAHASSKARKKRKKR